MKLETLKESQPQGRRWTFVIASSDYMHSPPGMLDFHGTYRQMLEFVNHINNENRDEPFTRDGKDTTLGQLSDQELEKLFNEANGDGQPYIMVWCVEQRKKVLG